MLLGWERQDAWLAVLASILMLLLLCLALLVPLALTLPIRVPLLVPTAQPPRSRMSSAKVHASRVSLALPTLIWVRPAAANALQVRIPMQAADIAHAPIARLVRIHEALVIKARLHVFIVPLAFICPCLARTSVWAALLVRIRTTSAKAHASHVLLGASMILSAARPVLLVRLDTSLKLVPILVTRVQAVLTMWSLSRQVVCFAKLVHLSLPLVALVAKIAVWATTQLLLASLPARLVPLAPIQTPPSRPLVYSANQAFINHPLA